MARDVCNKQLDWKKDIFIKFNLENDGALKDFFFFPKKTVLPCQSLANNTPEICEPRNRIFT